MSPKSTKHQIHKGTWQIVTPRKVSKNQNRDLDVPLASLSTLARSWNGYGGL